VPRPRADFKPDKFREHLTPAEVAYKGRCHVTWLFQLEEQGRIPVAMRYKGTRLWSPAQVKEIFSILSTLRTTQPVEVGVSLGGTPKTYVEVEDDS
jgi:hypothetical protein